MAQVLDMILLVIVHTGNIFAHVGRYFVDHSQVTCLLAIVLYAHSTSIWRQLYTASVIVKCLVLGPWS